MAFIGKQPTPSPLTASDITDGIITNAKLAQDIISAETELATAPADTDEFLISDAGTLKRIDASLVGGGGITEADQWRVTSGFTGDANPLSSNLERVDTSGWAKIGTGMSESSGIFTFPSTGIWLVKFHVQTYLNAQNRYTTGAIQITTNNSSYNNIASGEQGIYSEGSNIYGYVGVESLIDCTDTSNVKVRFYIDCENNNTIIQGNTDVSYTSMTFIRLGDT